MGCPRCGAPIQADARFCPRCGGALGIPGMSMPGRRLDGLATALTVLLPADAACALCALALPIFGLLEALLALANIVLVIVWLYRARRNVGHLGRHLRALGWAIGGWFCPVVFLWFPFQVVLDAARTDSATRHRMPWFFGGWWGCWVLAWATSFHATRTPVNLPDGSVRVIHGFGFLVGSTVASEIFVAAAGVLLVLVVRYVTARQRAIGLG